MSRAKDERLIKYAALQHKVASFLEGIAHQKVDIESCELYLIDEMQFRFVDSILQEVFSLQQTPADEKKFSTFKLINILNKTPSPAYTYSIRYKVHRYEHVIDQDKVYERLEKEFELFRNSKHQALKEAIALHHGISEAKRRELTSAFNEEITTAKTILKQLLENPEAYEMRFSAFQGNNTYACIDFVQEDKTKSVGRTIRKTAANLLWFESRISKDDRTSSVEAFINDPRTSNPFSRIYFRPKDKS
jgi:hypothetical protein